MRVSDIQSLDDLASHPRCIELMSEAAGRAPKGENAREFIGSLPLKYRLGAGAAKALGEELGLKSKSEKTVEISGAFGHVALGLLCALAAQGLGLEQWGATEPGRGCYFEADIPSSPLAWKGALSVKAEETEMNYTIEASAVFPGQAFAWGRGGRIIKRLFTDVARYVRDFEIQEL